MKSFVMGLTIFSIVSLYPAQSKAYDNVLVWRVVPGSSGFIQTNTLYRLFNIVNSSYLDYYSRSHGINLAFNVHLTTPNIKFVKAGNPNGPIHYGDKFAIHVDRGGYLYYTHQNYGINLSYSSTPVYEWEMRDNSYLNSLPDNNASIPSSATFSLINTHNSGYVIYGSRTWGPNLTWATTAPQPTATVAQVNLSVRTGPYSIHSTSGRCTGRVVWTFTPVSLTGITGTSTAFSLDRSYDVFETSVGPSEIWCIFNDIAPGLKAGRWKIKAQTPVWGSECEVSLTNGTNVVNFTQYKTGCGTGLQYP